MKKPFMVLNMTTELFPGSPGAWDSLAEAYWRSGNVEKATELYNKVIELDPDGPTAGHARRMLEKIKIRRP
jgi:cytochrome c-type biogenesis protein CcmH/NrfG